MCVCLRTGVVEVAAAGALDARLQRPITINVVTITTTPHNRILPDCFTPPNAKVEHGSASTSVLLSLG